MNYLKALSRGCLYPGIEGSRQPIFLKPYDNDRVAHVSDLLVDVETRTAIVVAPQSEIAPYLADVAQLGMHIRSVFPTHFDPDFPDRHLALRDQIEAIVGLGTKTQADYAFQPFEDDDSHKCGSIRLQILETPSHFDSTTSPNASAKFSASDGYLKWPKPCIVH